MDILPCIYNNSITVCHVDIIGMAVAISPLERTRNRGTAKREVIPVIESIYISKINF